MPASRAVLPHGAPDSGGSQIRGRIYDAIAGPGERFGLAVRRQRLLRGLGGGGARILEIGAGTGFNFRHYPAGVSVTAIEPNPSMRRRAENRVAGAEAVVEVVAGNGCHLEFEDGSFDEVVVTLVLCSVADPAKVLSEAARVAAPGGAIHFIEHVRSDAEKRAAWQDRLEKPWRLIGGGCRPNRRTIEIMRSEGFEVLELERFDIGNTLVNPFVAGVAKKAVE